MNRVWKTCSSAVREGSVHSASLGWSCPGSTQSFIMLLAAQCCSSQHTIVAHHNHCNHEKDLRSIVILYSVKQILLWQSMKILTSLHHRPCWNVTGGSGQAGQWTARTRRRPVLMPLTCHGCLRTNTSTMKSGMVGIFSPNAPLVLLKACQLHLLLKRCTFH